MAKVVSAMVGMRRKAFAIIGAKWAWTAFKTMMWARYMPKLILDRSSISFHVGLLLRLAWMFLKSKKRPAVMMATLRVVKFQVSSRFLTTCSWGSLSRKPASVQA